MYRGDANKWEMAIQEIAINTAASRELPPWSAREKFGLVLGILLTIVIDIGILYNNYGCKGFFAIIILTICLSIGFGYLISLGLAGLLGVFDNVQR